MLTLKNMDSTDFQRYLNYAIKNYAAEHVKAGNWSEEEAIEKSTNEYNNLLPEGEKTSNHKLFTIHANDQEVGVIWLGIRSEEKGFIYDINIWEGNQGLGYGKQAMKEIEVVGKSLGLKSIRLHVFGHNEVARSLYKKLGYIETDIVMEKILES